MTKEDVNIILSILHEKYGFDDLDCVEFIIEYERKSGNAIPDDWLGIPGGRLKTVKLDNK